MLDLLIKNGLIVDGTGSKGYNADLGVIDGRIVQINKNISCEANEIIDAAGLVVAPGFIDVHSHNDLVPFMEERLKGLKLMQGVTTELVGQCGLGVVPCMESKNKLWKNYVRGVVGDPGQKWEFHDMQDYMEKISLRGLKNNYAALISHGAIKASVMGFDKSIPNCDQIYRMCEIAEDAMESGAFGMSVGLQYMPAIFSKKDELTAICRVINKYNGILMVHLRNHDSTIINALDEIIDIALASGVKLHISHMRSYDSEDLGCSAEKLINYIEKALKKGVRITFDEHLYLSGSTLMTQLFPPFISDGGPNSMLNNLKDKQMLKRIKEELTDRSLRYAGWDNYSAVTGWDGILLTSLAREENKRYIGRSVGDISRELNVHPVDFAADLIAREQGGVGIVTMNVFSEEDTVNLIRHPLQMVGSDSIPAGVPHPRLYGNFPLFFGKYIRQKKVVSLEEGVYKSTLLPVKTLGLKNIGELSVGKTADITIFNFDNIIGYEDYFNPTRAPEGVRYVILNGRLAVNDGRLCSGYNGRVIRYNK